MNNLNPTTVVSAGRVMAPFLGYVWPDNRVDVVKGVNDARNLLFNRYNRQKMFADAFHCFVPQTFYEGCGTSRCGYFGATLPPDMQGVEKVWQCGEPLRIRSRWREAFTGKIQCSSEASVVLMPRKYPTEREMKIPAVITIFTESSQDTGKVVIMEVRTKYDGDQKLKFTLSGDEWVQSTMDVAEIYSVSLPCLTGKLTLSTLAGFTLSEYAPWETVPSYARVKLLTPCPHNVFIQGTRRFVPVWFDSDIVEMGDAIILEWLAQYLRYNKSRTESERRTAADALAQAYNSLDGLMARDLAGAIQDNIRRGPKPVPQLPGYGRRAGWR